MNSTTKAFLLLEAVIHFLSSYKTYFILTTEKRASKLILFQLVRNDPQARVMEQLAVASNLGGACVHSAEVRKV